KRLIINDYRSFCFCASALSSGIFGWKRERFRGNVIHKIGWLNLFAQQCKQMNININAVFRKDRLNSQNAAPVHLRLTQTRKNKFISTGITLNIDDWDFENQRIKAKTPELQALQLRIDTKIDELRRKIKRSEALAVNIGNKNCG
ncbi:Arm DNA-binding domain-containing protein, partial [Alistipes finegoldii]|uniref:Arm DNA-binding domain-containing protein n=6 Tax=Alistipes finegoldii TaxID=214856 RepID=UPI00258B09BD